jgi:O-antigen ligase
MPYKPHLTDYEPITRPKPSTNSASEPDGDEEAFTRRRKSSNPEAVADWLDADSTPQAVAPTPKVPVAQTEKKLKRSEIWLVKRGHALSFAGLFLFTFVLYFRPYEWSVSLTGLSTIAFWIAAATLLVFVPTQLALEGNITARPAEVNLLLLLLLAALLSLTFAIDRSVAWWSLVEYSKVAAMFIVMVNVVRTELRLKLLLWLVILVSIVVSIAAVIDYRAGNLALEGRRIAGVIGGLFSNPNDLALHLVVIVPIAIGLALATRNPLAKIFYLLCALLFISGIVVTFSRGGFMGLIAAISVLAWKLARRARLVFALVGILVIGAVVAVAPAAFRGRLGTTGDASMAARTDDLKRSLYLAIRHPVFGIGMGNYIFYSNRAKATHNAYTQVAAEMGIAAGVFYIMFLVVPFKRLLGIEVENRGQRKKPPHYYLVIGLQAALFGFMVTSFFSSVAYLWYPYYLVGYAICVRRIYFQKQVGKTATTGLS